MEPFFSLIGPAIRNDRYEGIYNNLSHNNKISFEIVFVGDKKPIEKMPSNFRYIYTKVKPMQCLEIGARDAIGEYIMAIQDDLVFSPEFLNRMHKHIEDNKNNKVLITPRYAKGKKYDDSVLNDKINATYFNKKKKVSPRIGICPAYKKELWNQLGGIDRGFLGCHGVNDLQMRFFEKGYKILDALDCCIYEIIKLKDFVRLIYRSGELDEESFLNSLWTNKRGEVVIKRNSLLCPFKDEDILIKSQGKCDKSQWD